MTCSALQIQDPGRKRSSSWRWAFFSIFRYFPLFFPLGSFFYQTNEGALKAFCTKWKRFQRHTSCRHAPSALRLIFRRPCVIDSRYQVVCCEIKAPVSSKCSAKMLARAEVPQMIISVIIEKSGWSFWEKCWDRESTIREGELNRRCWSLALQLAPTDSSTSKISRGRLQRSTL